MAIFDPSPQYPHPLTDHQKFVTGDYVGDPYGCGKFGANPSMVHGGLLGKWVKYNEFYLFISRTHLQVRPVDGFHA